MPDEIKGPEAVLPEPEGAKAPTQTTPPAKPDAPVGATAAPPAAADTKPTTAEEKKPAAAVTPVAPAGKPADAAKPAAAAAKPAVPAAAKPAAPAKPAGPVPEPWTSDLVTNLKKQYGSGIKETSTYVGQKYLVVDSAILFGILRRMCEEEQYNYCVDVTAVHWPKREQPFDIVYILYSFHHNDRIRIKAQISEGQHVQSAVNLWPTTNWLEREVFDMFGIVFDGHPDLKRILLPDGWKGHPLRKDYNILQQDTEWVKANLGIESGQ
jgi:NADH-quinone oxidoreductase subunit C